jgi:sugar O-acyltransferase (sialic acid O-acetyltransferase NeuD family)
MIEITVPLLNANEPEARLIEIHAKEGQRVEKGAPLFTLETTKAAADVESPADGYFRLIAKDGDTLEVGDLLAVLTDSPDEPFTVKPKENAPAPDAASEIRITAPARALAQTLGVDLDSLPADKLITEAVLREIVAERGAQVSALEMGFTDNQILMYGGGGHAKSVMEMIRAAGMYEIAGIIDDGIPAGTRILDIPVLGKRDLLPALVAGGLKIAANGVGGILNIAVRVRLFELMSGYGLEFPPIIHPRATVEPSASVGEGVQIFAHAYVGSSAILHARCMVNTAAVVSHDCKIGAYTHIAPGALLAGHVHVGERSLVGMGVTTAIGIKIGNGVRIGNGAVIYADVPDQTIIPAGKVWEGITR